MDIDFKEFPLSYRLSQKGLAVASVASAIAARVARGNLPVPLLLTVVGIIGTIFLVGLVSAAYVVIRYPFLSLVNDEHEDVFSKHFSDRNIVVFRWLMICAMVVVPVCLAAMWMNGRINPLQIGISVYLVILFGFFCFLVFRYSPDSHPTVATFIRATLGLGILLFPLFAPVIWIGSIRCQAMLDAEMLRQEMSPEYDS